MKNSTLLLFAACALAYTQTAVTQPTNITAETLSIQNDSVYFIKAKPEEGFNFDYYLFMPKGLDKSKKTILLVESTNTGLNDSIEHHRKKAKHAASKSSVGNYVSRKLKIPLVVPVFPRSETNWKVYSHAFDQETFNMAEGPLERLDLQLLAMVENAKKELNNIQVKVGDRFFITGFSASGTFANRFAILHPDKIQAVAAGGVNSILILPLANSSGKKLDFPIGINDVKSVTGKKVNLKSFRKLPQFWFMGENDDNDAAKFHDAYSDHERELIYSIIGKQMQERWKKVELIYRENKIPAIFKSYQHIGHRTDLNIQNEIADFFSRHLNY